MRLLDVKVINEASGGRINKILQLIIILFIMWSMDMHVHTHTLISMHTLQADCPDFPNASQLNVAMRETHFSTYYMNREQQCL